MPSALNRRFALSAILCLFAMSEAVFAQKVKVEYDKKTDFNRYKTYNWAKKNDEYLRPFLAAVVVGAVDHNLQQKGLKKVDAGGDLIVNPYGTLDTQMAVTGTPDIYYFPPVYGGPWWGAPMYRPGTSTATILKKGTLVIDLADPHSKLLMWRGIAEAKLDTTQKEKSLQAIEKSVEKMFKDYPGKPAQ